MKDATQDLSSPFEKQAGFTTDRVMNNQKKITSDFKEET